MFWPCALALTMAAYRNAVPLSKFLPAISSFLIGIFFLRGGIISYNDICDIKYDRQVERTKNRPLVTGAMSLTQAWIWTGIQIAIPICLLFLTNDTAKMAGIISLFPFHALYPFMKRWTYLPAAWLGLAFNWPLFVAWLMIDENLASLNVAIILFIGNWGWVMVYETIYQSADKFDDVKAGIKSTALLFGDQIKPILCVFGALFVASLAVCGLLNGQGPLYYVLTVCGCAVHLTWQFATWNNDNPKDCLAKFEANRMLGWWLWAGVLGDYALLASKSAMLK